MACDDLRHFCAASSAGPSELGRIRLRTPSCVARRCWKPRSRSGSRKATSPPRATRRISFARIAASFESKALAAAATQRGSPCVGGDGRRTGKGSAFRRRLTEIDGDIEEARTLRNEARQAQAETERDWLIRELSRATGLGGRDRTAGSDSDRARAAVTRAVPQAMARIRERDPALGAHLDLAIRTGTWCAYRPDTPVDPAWQV